MKCDRCDNEATIHELIVAQGQHVEAHLCERCARRAKGRQPTSGDAVSPADDAPTAPDTPINLSPSSDASAHSAAAGADEPPHELGEGPTDIPGEGTSDAGGDEASIIAGARTTCPGCKLTFAQFRHQGQMGCPACYAAFAELLAPLLARAHEGGTWHVGKKPARYRGAESAPAAGAAPVIATTRRLSMLRASLAEAISNEQYELAARLRDELRALLSARSSPEPDARSDAPPRGDLA
ncbi:MAG: UvrB/UvrC motif-containing protein [Planctomyces sp.]|jgi:protein-arginine kinase activator protein McsA